MIKNIIFDLGNVLYEVNNQNTSAAFSTLARTEIDLQQLISNHRDGFYEFEKGRIENDFFLDSLKEILSTSESTKEVKNAWNAMLVGVYPGREAWIKNLKKRFSISILSNTNKIHHEIFSKHCESLFEGLDHLFYSFELDSRKPDREIYEKTLSFTNYKPSETVFVDDLVENLREAEKFGIKTVHCFNPDILQNQLEEFLQSAT